MADNGKANAEGRAKANTMNTLKNSSKLYYILYTEHTSNRMMNTNTKIINKD